MFPIPISQTLNPIPTTKATMKVIQTTDRTETGVTETRVMQVVMKTTTRTQRTEVTMLVIRTATLMLEGKSLMIKSKTRVSLMTLVTMVMRAMIVRKKTHTAVTLAVRMICSLIVETT